LWPEAPHNKSPVSEPISRAQPIFGGFRDFSLLHESQKEYSMGDCVPTTGGLINV
jgi:hypothetical protein